MSGGFVRATLAVALLCACGKTAPRVESAASAPSVQNATISIGVTGSGSVLLSGQNAPCTASCRYSVPLHASVALTSAAGPGAGFAGWTGACSGNGECRFVADADLAVGATFRTVEVPPATLRLSIAINGKGAVRVWDARAGCTDCDQSCVVPVAPGDAMILANPAPGSRFLGWSGICSGFGACQLQGLELQKGASLEAKFESIAPPPWRYDAVDVSSIDGVPVQPSALDDSGALAGTYSRQGESGVFLWDGALHLYPVEGGTSAQVAATAGGFFAGTLAGGLFHGRGFVATQRALREVGTFGGTWSQVNAVDALGRAAGTAALADGSAHAFLWQDGALTDLGTLPGHHFSAAYSISGDGIPLGVSCDSPWDPPRNCHSVRFGRSGPSDLGDISDDFLVDAMTSSGTVALSRYPSEAFLWTDGSVADLSGEGAAYSWSRMGVYASGRLSSAVVGPNADGDVAVALWVPISEGDSGILALRHEDALYDINDLVDGPTVEWPRRIDGAHAINARGQILATARRSGGSSFLLTPKR